MNIKFITRAWLDTKMAAATSFSSGIGAFTFHAHQHGADECDSRGLPLTPNSIIMTGNFQQLKTMSHPNICQYLDLVKSPSEGIQRCNIQIYMYIASAKHKTMHITCIGCIRWHYSITYWYGILPLSGKNSSQLLIFCVFHINFNSTVFRMVMQY